jgi:hypothetical protein
MTREAIATACKVWRHDGRRKTTEGELELTADGELRFRIGDDVAWRVEASTVDAKCPWYSLGASLKIKAPAPAAGLFMGYPPGNRGAVGNSIDTASARSAIKHLSSLLAQAGRTDTTHFRT